MAKSRNNLLGVGGQRGKLPRPGKSAQSGPADRRAAETQKQELARKMRERLSGATDTGAEGEPKAAPGAEATDQS